jgi:hypothetical protein
MNMSGARQRRRKTLRAQLAHALATQVGNFASLPAKDVAAAVTLMVDAENGVRCMSELRKTGKLGMFELAKQFEQIARARVHDDAPQVVVFAATRGMQDLNGIAALFTAHMIDEITRM